MSHDSDITITPKKPQARATRTALYKIQDHKIIQITEIRYRGTELLNGEPPRPTRTDTHTHTHAHTHTHTHTMRAKPQSMINQG